MCALLHLLFQPSLQDLILHSQSDSDSDSALDTVTPYSEINNSNRKGVVTK